MSVAALSLALLLGGAPALASLTPGTVDVTLTEPVAADAPFADAVTQALIDHDFVAMPRPDHGRYIAEVSVVRDRRGVVVARVPNERATAGLGNWGGGINVPLGTHKTRLQDLSVVTLTVRLIARADRREVWSGSALTADVGRADTVTRLAQAALASFPVTTHAVASVP